MKFCSFDIEIAKALPEGETDWDAHRPLGISCAATICTGDERPTLWFEGQYSNSQNPTFGPKMSRESCQELVDYLTSRMYEGLIPLTWNGLSFDFKILAEESGRFDDCVKLALNHVDMMFHFFCLKGFPIGLDSACRGMGLVGKPEGMHGAIAPIAWQEKRYKEVLDYVAGDVDQPLELAELVARRSWLTWFTRKGTAANINIGCWLTVKEALELPEPDVSWMSDPWPRSKFYGWTEAA
jgi:hypothetical protein